MQLFLNDQFYNHVNQFCLLGFCCAVVLDGSDLSRGLGWSPAVVDYHGCRVTMATRRYESQASSWTAFKTGRPTVLQQRPGWRLFHEQPLKHSRVTDYIQH